MTMKVSNIRQMHLYKAIHRSLLFKPFIKLVKYIIEFIEDQYLDLYIISGSEKYNDLRVAFISKGLCEKKIFKMIFQGNYIIKKIKTFQKKYIVKEFNNSSLSVDLVVVDGKYDYFYKKLSGIKNTIFAPKWVMQINNTFTSCDYLKKFSRSKNSSAYDDIRKADKLNYTYEFTKKNNLIQFFYEKMYLPYAHNRYKDEGFTYPFTHIKKVVKKGGLLLVKDGSKYVSGSAIEFGGKTLRPVHLGVTNGDLSLVKKHALVALYYFYLKLAQEKDLKAIDLAASRAFLNDGVLRYKTKWGTSISYDKKRSSIFVYKICRFSKPIKEFLVNNPFISIENGKLIGNIYLDSNSNLTREEVTKKYGLRGLSELYVTDCRIRGNEEKTFSETCRESRVAMASGVNN